MTVFTRFLQLTLVLCMVGIHGVRVHAQDFVGLEYDFGVLPTDKESAVLEHVFELENNTDETLAITDVMTSCGCIQLAQKENLSIAPRSKSKVKVLLDVSKQRGNIKQSVAILSDKRTFRLRLLAMKKSVWAAPPKADLGFVAGQKRLLSTILLYESGFSDGKVESASSNNDAFQVVVGELKQNARTPEMRSVAALHVTYKNSKGSDNLGPQNATISVTFDCGNGEKRVVAIPVTSIVVSEHKVIPQAIFFGNVSPGKNACRQLSFEPQDSRVENLTIESDSDLISASISPDTKENSKYSVSVSINLPSETNIKTKLIRASVKIKERDSVIVSIPCLAVIHPAGRNPTKLNASRPDAKGKEPGASKPNMFHETGRILRWFDSLEVPDSAPTWVMAHYALAASESGQRQKAIETLLNTKKSHPAFVNSNNRYFGSRRGAFFETQHHPDQFLAYLSLSGVSIDQSLTPRNLGITLEDLLRHSQWDSGLRGEELSWKVIAYSIYGDKLGANWKNKFSEVIDLETIVKRLLEQDENACLGTHKFMAIVCYYNLLAKNKASVSTDLKATIRNTVQEKIQELKKSQRIDGALAVPEGLVDKRLWGDQLDVLITGHMLENLMVLETIDPDEEWIQLAVNSLCRSIRKRIDRHGALEFESDVYCREFGQLCHAISGLRRWKNRTAQQ